MQSALVIVGFAVVAVVLQTTLFHLVPAGGVLVPDFMLVLCVYLGLRHQSVGGAIGAFLLGYLLDAFSGADVGINAFGMTLVFLIVYLLSRRLWIESGWSIALVVFAAAVLRTLAVAGLVSVFSGTLTFEGARDDMLGGGLAAVLTPFVFGALGRAKRRLGVL